MTSTVSTDNTCSTSDRVISDTCGRMRDGGDKAAHSETTGDFGSLIEMLRQELHQLMKYDESLLRQLQNLDVSISALSAAIQVERPLRDVQSRCRYASTSTVSDIDNVETGPVGICLQPITACATDTNSVLSDVVTDDVIYESGFIDNQSSELKIGNRIATPCARVLSWIGDSNFENDANEHDTWLIKNTSRKPNNVVRKRSRTSTESNVIKRRSVSIYPKRLENDTSLDTVNLLLRNEQLCQRVRSQSVSDFRKSADDTMFRSESYSSLHSHGRTSPRVMDPEPFLLCTRRLSVSWRPFTFMDSLDSYFMGHVGSRLKFQPRPRLHRQTNVSEHFDGHSAKVFLSQTELRDLSGLKESLPKGDIVLSEVTSVNSSSNTTDTVGAQSVFTANRCDANRPENASVPVLQKSDSGYDDSYEESDRDSQIGADKTARVAVFKRERRDPVRDSDTLLNASNESCTGSMVCSDSQKCPDEKIELTPPRFVQQKFVHFGDKINHTCSRTEQCERDENLISKTDAQIEPDIIKHIDFPITSSGIHEFTSPTPEITKCMANETDNEIIAILESSSSQETLEERYLDIHDGMITCRIMSPNLERQISEQHEHECEEFEYLSIVDGRVVFRPRDTCTEIDLEDSYCLQGLFEETSINMSDEDFVESVGQFFERNEESSAYQVLERKYDACVADIGFLFQDECGHDINH